MSLSIQFSGIALPKNGAVIVLAAEGAALSGTAAELDIATKKSLSRAMQIREFKGKKNQLISLLAPTGVTADLIVLAGIGKEKDHTPLFFQNLGGKLLTQLNTAKVKQAVVIIDAKLAKSGMTADEIAANLAYGANLRSYRFGNYLSKPREEDKLTVTKLVFQLKDATKASKRYDSLDAVATGVCLARDLVSEPPNILHPESYAERCKDLSKLGLKVEVLTRAQMEKLGMGALLGVAQGSKREARLVVLQWKGAKSEKAAPIAFVGKGVTFDTGGISIKPSAGMEDMKYDMAGSAAVVGTLVALALRKAKVNAVGVIGLVENMPSGNAQRPSDIVKTMSGQTVEVLNTDAEGRLVLADALWYCQDKFKPQFMIDLATLTGAIVIALGEHQYAGMFSNTDKVCAQLSKAGEKVGEKVWRFPMGDEYDKLIDSPAADVKNISDGRGAGSITAAQFLQRFVNKTPWVHLDIAGMAWDKKGKDITPKGATGFGVRLLNELVAEYYE